MKFLFSQFTYLYANFMTNFFDIIWIYIVKLKTDSSRFDLLTRFDSPLKYGKKWHAVYGIYKNWGSTFYSSVMYHLHRVRTVKFRKLVSMWDPKKLLFFIYFWSTVQQHHTFQDVLHKYITFYNSISCSIIDTKRE